MSNLKAVIEFITKRREVVEAELEQSILRVSIVSLMVIYLAVMQIGDPTPGHLMALYSVSAFLFASFLIFAWVAVGPADSRLRKIVGIAHDVGGLTCVMYFFDAATAPFYIAFLWVIFGNGFRYGTAFMALAAVASAVGFGLVISLNPYWSAHTGLGIGLLLGLIVLPAYVATLIKRLNEATRIAVEANKAKSRFLATMSHELRTPLNGVIGVADLLRATPLNPEQEEHARTISVSANSLLALIDEVLDISKIEAGKMVVDEVDFDLHRLVGNTTKMMAAPASKKCLHMSSRVSPEIPFALNGSEHHLQQILVNLIGNAIKFTEQGHVELNVTLAERDGDDAVTWIRFEVIDTGIGIPKEAQARIFDRFAQADESTTRRYGGTGLGITISKQLAEMMGGEIGVISEPGQGSTFWMELPFRELPATPEDKLEERTLGESRVLVVTGDHAESRRVMTLLSGWGVKAQQRDAAAQAIAELVNAANTGKPYNTVVVDNRGSRSDPVQLMQTAKQDKLLESLAFVLISPPLADADWKQRFLDMGFAAVLATPFDKTLLFNALHSVCATAVEDPQVVNFIDHYARERKVLPALEILVAEDNRVNQTVVRGILEKAGHRVYLVENGEQALDALDAHRFDVALFDIQMPVMDGIEALKIYRFTHTNPDAIPIVMLSADVTAEVRAECDEAGAAAFIAKPIQARTLLGSLTTVLENDRSGHRGAGDRQIVGVFAPGELPESPLSPEVLDRRTLADLEQLGGNLQFVDNLIDGFVRDTDSLFDQLSKAIATRSTRQFRDLAHALKGSAGSVGASRLNELSNRACCITDRDFTRMAPVAVSQMRSAFAEAKGALLAYITERKNRISRS
jgi:two-component system sensor histidine kinase RpfC